MSGDVIDSEVSARTLNRFPEELQDVEATRVEPRGIGLFRDSTPCH